MPASTSGGASPLMAPPTHAAPTYASSVDPASPRTIARYAGAIYLLIIIGGIFAQIGQFRPNRGAAGGVMSNDVRYALRMLVFGLTPSWHASRFDIGSALKQESRGGT